MSNWTPKQTLSGLMSKFRQSGSEESSNSSLAEEAPAHTPAFDAPDEPTGLSTSDVAVSPLALMNENSPEAWLGQFLLKLEAPTSTARGTLEGARRDTQLIEYLQQVRVTASEVQPLSLLDEQYARDLRARDWSAWWKGQGALLSYSYSTLSLSLLGDSSMGQDLQVLHEQESNMQLKKDTHYVLCYVLGKPWPSYRVTESDFRRLSAPQE